MLNAMEKTDSAPFSSETGNNIDEPSPSHAPPLGDVISSGDFDHDDEGAGPCPVTGTLTQKTIGRSCDTSAGSHSTLSPIKWSQVKESLRPSESDCCGGGASGGHPDDRMYSLPIATPYYSARASDPADFSSDDETFITLQETVVSAASPKNTFECSRRLSAPGQLVQDAGSEAELQSRRPGIAEFFSSKKQRSASQSVPGWKLFGKIPPKQSPSKQARIIQQKTAVILSSLGPQDLTEYEARQAAALYSPTHHVPGQQTRRNKEFEPLSTTALILEQRPLNLPSKSAEETQRHKQQYEQMVAGAKKSELKDAQRKQQQMRERFKQEDVIANATMVWNTQILPHWDSMRSSRRTRDLWWVGLPPSVRGQVWRLAIGNELNITTELYDIFLSRAKKKWRNLGEQDDGIPPAATESSLELIKQDVSRAFPTLGVFQEGGPYHDMLQSILGAYICYRPDVGYVLGMSSVAALLILNMDEVDTFISFSNLVNKPCLLTFYRVDHQLMLKYFRAFDIFFEENLPCLFLHFQTSGVTPDLYLMDWILSLYTKSLPLEVVCRVWDIFFRDGEEFLFRAALGILQLYQDVLLSMDLVSIAQFLSHLPTEELLSDRLFSCIGTIPMLSANRKWTQVLSSMNSS